MSKHIHQFQRRTLGKDKDYIVYACVMPNCSTYYPEELAIGKETRCNRCKKEVVIIKRNSSGKVAHKPHCKECTYEPRNPQLRKKRLVRAPKTVVQDLTKLLLD